MAIGTFDELKAAVESWYEGDDLSGALDDLVTLAEAQLNRDVQSDARYTRTTDTLSAAEAYFDLPDDVWGILVFRVNSATAFPLELLPPDAFWRLAIAYESGVPEVASVQGGRIYLAPIPDGDTDLALDYVAAIPALSDDNATNWLLTKAPDVYLYACLAQAAIYVQDDNALQRFTGLYERSLGSFHGADHRLISRPIGRVMAG